MKRNRWLIALATVLIHLSAGSIYAYSVLVNPIIQSCGFGLTETTFIFSVAIFALGTAASLWGKYVDKYGAKRIGLIATVLFCSGWFGSALALHLNSIVLLYIMFYVLGTGIGLLYICPVSTLVKYFPKRIGFCCSIAIFGFGMGSVLASALMGYFVDVYGLIYNFIILGIVYGIVLIPSCLYLAPPSNAVVEKILHNDPDIKPKDVYKTWQFKALCFTFLGNITCGIGILSLLSPMLQANFAFNAMQASVFVAVCGLANGVGRFFWATLSDTITRPVTYVIFALLGAVSYWSIAITSNLYIFEICTIIIISMYGGFFSALPPYLSDLFGRRYLSTIHGKALQMWAIAGVLGPIMLALCKELTNSYTPVMYIFVMIMLINLYILQKLKQDTFKRKSIFNDIE